MQGKDVIVVGAGVAGLACARALSDTGREVVVLEARTRIGGRVSTLRTATGAVVELGAQVMHPTADIALDEVVREAGLRTRPLSHDTTTVVVEGGRRWDAAELTRDRPPAPWIVERWLSTAGSGTVAEVLHDIPVSVRTLATAWLEQSVGGDHRILDVAGVVMAREARSQGRERIVVDGFDLVVKSLAADLDVRLEMPVDVIRWGDNRVEIDAQGQLTARVVVVTVPPSVVLAGGLRFDPPLPSAKTAAMTRLASCDALSIVLNASEAASKSTWVLLVDPPGGIWRTSYGSTIVTGHVKGPAAALARNRPWMVEDAAQVAALIDPELGSVMEVHLCDWGTDPWARGAFSIPVTGVNDAVLVWAEPLAGRLFFAGEASADPVGRGLVQGAISSGRRAASEVLARLAHE